MNDNNAGALFDALVDVFAQRVADKINGDGLYTVDDLAARYSLSKSAIRQRINAGEFGEVVKLGSRCHRVTAAGVRRYEAAHMVQIASQPKAARAGTDDHAPPGCLDKTGPDPPGKTE